MELKELGYLIEQERCILNMLAQRYGVLDQRTLAKSEEIDIMVSEYNRQRMQLGQKKNSI
ncbi:Spo0E family sporulation regulatory protein-aspartic acid phosphatase [Paenibacillus crassostreae]|uniref:Sporulation protein Spo0E n=1 Tax=Paenibacillus crassostreae TaxID=1763538 RepID=A0A167EJP1_9BACL|nr:Spo0E family sporulation regulatory protein-aspartic acid phosphatase [Paenibacillus crassostreae]AOZ94927.1 hypothetical protein LPB68_21955 [Paenibacillus crassostreae]OAB75609.1 hypothetical protein PNBC_08245 [Paenibacillus crassostreae]